MLEKEFAQRYSASQNNTHAAADLVEATRALMNYTQKNKTVRLERDRNGTRIAEPLPDDTPETAGTEGVEGTVFSMMLPDAAPEASQSRKAAKHSHAPARRPKRHRWMMPVAACLAALLVLFGVGSAVLPGGLPFMQEQDPIRAYAKTPNLLTAELGDNIVPFAIDERTAFQGWNTDPDATEEGSYTGLQFTIEGENIASVQATISRGELYRITTATYDRTTEEGRAILSEAAGWKPTARGTGTYLRDYDYVGVYMLPDDLDKTDPNRKEQLRFIKRYGSTVDVPYEGEPLTFGLWFDGTIGRLANYEPNLFELDGTELTLTAVYTNGTFRTQKMTLHDGYFKVVPAGNDTEQGQAGADEVMAEGPFTAKEIDRINHEFDSDRWLRRTVHTLYGEVTSITDTPHPYPLDNANERANAPVEPMPLFDEPGFTPSTGVTTFEEIPDSDNIHSINGDLAIGQWSYERNGWADLRWSDISAYLTDTLPGSISLFQNTEVWAFSGNVEYMNVCRLQTRHWTVSDKGHVNDGNSFVILDVTVANAEDEEVMFSGRDVRGSICAVDEESGTTLFADGGLFGAADELGRTWGHGMEDSFRLGPHESLRLHIAFIADDRIAQADEVLFTLTSLAELEPYHGKSRTSFNEVEFFSLGKLERR